MIPRRGPAREPARIEGNVPMLREALLQAGNLPACVPADPDEALLRHIESKHRAAIADLAEELARRRRTWIAAREHGEFARILQAELRYAETAAALAARLRQRGESEATVEAYLTAKRRENDRRWLRAAA